MKAGKLACIVLLVAGMMGCSKTTKQPEQEEGKALVWWIDKEHAQAPWFKHTNSLQDKQYLQNKYTEECNRLLKQRKFPYEVKFRYMNREDSAYASASDTSYFKKLTKSGEAVDLFMTTQGNLQDMEMLDTYLNEDAKGKQLYEAIPAYYWQQNQVNGHIAYVPDIALYDVQMVTGIHKTFAKQSKVTRQDLQTPQSFTRALRSIKDTFGEEVLPLDQHMDIRFLLSDYQPVRSLESSRIAVKKTKEGWKVVDLFQEDQFQAWLKQLQLGKKEQLLGLQLSEEAYQKIWDTQKVFFQTGLFNPLEKQSTLDAKQYDITYGSSITLRPSGVAVYQGSKHKEAAKQLLSLIYTDQKLSDLFLYGLADIDYQIQKGTIHPLGKGQTLSVAIEKATGFAGNYLITTPSTALTKNDQQHIREHVQQLPNQALDTFYPELDEREKDAIYVPWSTFMLSNVINQKPTSPQQDELIDTIVKKLQTQLDAYLIE